MALSRSIAVLVTLAMAACGGGDGPTGPDPGERTIKDNPSFSQDVFEILTRRGCTASDCHGSGQGGLTMTSAANAYGNLVGRPAAGRAGETLVVPGDAAASYLVKKLEGASGIAGARMPLGGQPLDNIDLTNIRNWINRGANNN